MPLSSWQGPGQPYLIPCQTTHRRFFPEKHSFTYSYLTVGIPVGYQGSAHGMIGVYDSSFGENTKPVWVLTDLLSRSWFQVTASDHFDRETGLDLRGKLDRFLKSEQVNPTDYPHAYLITAPRFLRYNFNPVSLWYLYSKERTLSAMILEVNNTYGERRPYLVFRDFGIQPNRSPERAKIQQSFVNKDFYVSPFNTRDGYYSVLASDPLGPDMDGFAGVDVTITLNSPSSASSPSKGKPKLVARLFSRGRAVNPIDMGSFEKLRFLAAWSHVGFTTMPKIVKEACVLLYSRGLQLRDKPEPMVKTLGRRPSSLERDIEECFQEYLENLVRQLECPLTLKIYTDGFSSVPAATFVSQRSPKLEGRNERSNRIYTSNTDDNSLLEVRVLTPAFYSRFILHLDSADGICHELDVGKTLWANNPELLSGIFKTTEPDRTSWQQLGLRDFLLAAVISRMRQTLSKDASSVVEPQDLQSHPALPLIKINLCYTSSMDIYMTFGCQDMRLKRRYQWAAIWQLAAEKYFMGRPDLLRYLVFILCMGVLSSLAVGFIRNLC